MAKRSVRRRRLYERLGPKPTPEKPPECEAEDCTDFPLARVYLTDLGREVDVCPAHAKLLEIQIARNENVGAARSDRDRKRDRRLVEEKLGLS